MARTYWVLFDRMSPKFFILGKIAVDDPYRLGRVLELLRTELLADPYFKGVPSFQPEAQKTALVFHAKDDLAEVRREVFRVLVRHHLRFYAVVRDKQSLLSLIRKQNKRDPSYRYRPNEVYDSLVTELFAQFHPDADEVGIWFAKRGHRDRTHALAAALEKAHSRLRRNHGLPFQARVAIWPGTPRQSANLRAGLQAVDYFLWALQRFYERGEDRFIEMLWSQVEEVHDLDYPDERGSSTVFFKDNPLNRNTRRL